MRVLFDTNVVLDVLLARVPHVEVAVKLFNLVDRGILDGLLCATTVTTTHYLATKSAGQEKARAHISTLLSMFEVAPVDREVLDGALRLEFVDYEDAVLHEAAMRADAGAIVTRNVRDFEHATVPVFDPDRLLAAVLAARTPVD